MTDIIANAKQLLDGATPAPWVTGGKDESENIYVGNPSEAGNLVATAGSADADLIAAAPEHTEALAEETWEYSFQIRYADGWETACNDVTEIDEWWPTRSEAEEAAASAYDPYIDRPIRLIRRRVSPVEVIQ